MFSAFSAPPASDLRAVVCDIATVDHCTRTSQGISFVASLSAARRLCESAGLSLVAPADAQTNADLFSLCPPSLLDVVALPDLPCNRFVLGSANDDVSVNFTSWAMKPNNGNASSAGCSKGMPLTESCVAFYEFSMSPSNWFDRPCAVNVSLVEADPKQWSFLAPSCAACGRLRIESTSSHSQTLTTDNSTAARLAPDTRRPVVAIVGGLIGGFSVLCVLILISVCVYRRRRKAIGATDVGAQMNNDENGTAIAAPAIYGELPKKKALGEGERPSSNYAVGELERPD